MDKRNFKEKLKSLKEKIFDIFFPNDIKCILCGKDKPEKEELFCKDCLKDNIFNTGNRCQKCDMQIKEGNIVCDNCKSEKKHFDKCFCPLNYTGNVRKAILKLKDNNAKYLIEPFCKLIYERLTTEDVQFDVIVPVPSHPKTIKKRGYNVALLLAIEISKLSGKPVVDVLEKNVFTKTQKSLSYQQRQTNLENSMTCKAPKAVKGKNVLIVDDIITTGSTINCCGALLTKANKIYATAIARTLLK